MSVLVLIFGLFSGCFLSVLVGLLGRKRKIGFGLSFLVSLIFTPLVGLIVTLLSEENENSERGSWGCVGTFLAIAGFCVLMLLIVLVVMGVSAN